MRVMIIGSGGREHALAWAIAQSPRVTELICVPGNAGIGAIAENVAADISDIGAMVELARKRRVDLTVVGPEAPLCVGIVDQFTKAGLRIFGPTAAAARIEGDKAYARRLMRIAHVPMAEGQSFTDYQAARNFIAARDTGVVVKASGLAAGKGVFVCPEPADALIALEQIMVDRKFGDAGEAVVVEDLLKGQELSVIALVSGHTIYTLEAAQDHKPIGRGDTGPNTGGMGAYSPAPIATPELLADIERDVLVPIVDALRNDEAPYCGALYAGLILTPAGPKVLEFNCRFGDPETQAVLMRLRSDLVDAIEATVDDRLDQIQIDWDPRPAVCVVMSSKGYPGPCDKGKVIEGLKRVSRMEDVQVFHAGTSRVEHLTVTSGGRVLGVTALGLDITIAKRRAYEAIDAIEFEGAYCRRDIADKAISEGATT